MNALVRRQVVAGAGRHVGESRVPTVVVSNGAVYAKFVRAVRIGEDSLARGAIARLAAPTLAEREIEPLIARQAIEDGRYLAAQRNPIGLVRDDEAGEIGNVLPERQPPVYVQTG